jgi:hypothetical protein
MSDADVKEIKDLLKTAISLLLRISPQEVEKETEFDAWLQKSRERGKKVKSSKEV